MIKMWRNCLLTAFLTASIPTFAQADQVEAWHRALADPIKKGVSEKLQKTYEEKGPECLFSQWEEIKPYLERMKKSSAFAMQYTASVILEEIASSFPLLRDKANAYLK